MLMRMLACDEHGSLSADEDTKGEWLLPVERGVELMSPAGGDRFLSRGGFARLAAIHEGDQH